MSKTQTIQETEKKVKAMPDSPVKEKLLKDLQTKKQHDVKKG